MKLNRNSKRSQWTRKETPTQIVVGRINEALNDLEETIWAFGLPLDKGNETRQGKARREVWKAIRAWKKVQDEGTNK